MTKIFIALMELGLLPDWLIRFGVRRFCRERLGQLAAELKTQFAGSIDEARVGYARTLRSRPLATATDEANRQHYEVPTEFFLAVLGAHRKYSCTYFGDPSRDQHQQIGDLSQAEDLALQITMNRAELADGMRILELGCGWGSLTIAMARRFPRAKIVAISNSNTQREFIQSQLARDGLKNVEVITCDLSRDQKIEGVSDKAFDRVVSVEMFEHFQNYQLLLARISKWLNAQGKLFIHIFSHQKFSYPFEIEGDDNWMGRYFFSGGQMPSRDLLLEFQDSLQVERQWDWSGVHYQKTAEAWLANLDRQRDRILALFETCYGRRDAHRWLMRWRVFFISCSELFGFRNGTEWGVTHYLLSQRTEGGE